MSGDFEARAYIKELNRSVRPLALAAHETLTEQGCTSYVKTIYIGYDLAEQMVAALYAHTDHVEVALALAEDAEDQLLVDASHLTWRTLPVAALLRSSGDASAFDALVKQACDRVRLREHEVLRDNDFFMNARRERRRRL